MSSALSTGQSARAVGALLVANARYWTSVAPRVRAQLAHWEARARAIPDPVAQALACDKLREESFNAQVAATLATLPPRARRARVVEAIVALQVAYDYLDALGEQPPGAGGRDDRKLLGALADAFTSEPRHRAGMGNAWEAGEGGGAGEDPYLSELLAALRHALAELPATRAIADVAHASATRCGQAQLLGHAAMRSASAEGELERWARREAAGAGLGWPEYAAGASASVLGLHALIAAAADPRTTRRDAEALDAAYLYIAALTMLDSLVDREQDLAAGEQGYVRHYDDAEQMAERLAAVARAAARRAQTLPHAAHHTMTLAGVVAYYASAPAANTGFARPAIARACQEIGPSMAPTLAVMRVWRAAKRLRRPKRVVSSI